MIVHRLLALDTLKYARLELNDLPERGLILLTGQNEAGKSSIGEILCFALFGRTFALPPERISRIIRWDQSKATLEVEFTAAKADWTLHRQVDRNGGTSATLEDEDGETVVSGWAAVTERVEQLLGFGFREYVESFYLARREISPPHPRSETVRSMAGVLKLEQVASELGDRLASERRRVASARSAIADIDARVGQLVEDTDIPSSRAEADHRHEELEALTEDMEAGLPGLSEVVELVADADSTTTQDRWKHIASRLREGLYEGRAIEQTLGWEEAELDLAAFDSVASQVDSGLAALDQLNGVVRPRFLLLGGLLGHQGFPAPKGRIPFGDEEHEATLELRAGSRVKGTWAGIAGVSFLAAIVCAVFAMVPMEGITAEIATGARFALVFPVALIGLAALKIQGAMVNIQIARDNMGTLDDRRASALAEAQVLERFADLPPAKGLDELKSVRTQAIQAALTEFRGGPGNDIVAESGRRALAKSLQPALDGAREQLEGLRERVDEELEVLSKMHELFEERDELKGEIKHAAGRIATWELAVDLLEGASRDLTFQFNRDVRKSMVRILPSLTEGRYQYLQIDDDLQVRVFSSEKQDFVFYEEISGGTQRQIALATRLALSEGLVNTSVFGPQFVFLDEPFAFFDAHRTRQSMKKLPHLTETLSQIWVAAQEPPEGGEWDLHLQATRDTIEMVVSGARI